MNNSLNNSIAPASGIDEIQEEYSGLSLLCNKPFWDQNRAWDSATPQFGSCVERTVLLWGPCAFLWLFGICRLLILKRRPHDPIPWTALSYTKLFLSLLLLITGVTELIWATWLRTAVLAPSDILAPVVLLITYVLHIALICANRLRGKQTDGVLWVFWFSMILCGIPELISSVTTVVYLGDELPPVLVVIFLVNYIVAFFLFVTNWFCDAPSKLQLLTMSVKPSPESNASFPSQFMYWWCIPVIWLGFRRPLTFDDLWDVNADTRAAVLTKDWHDDFKSKSKSSKTSYNMGPNQSKQKVYVYWRLWRMCCNTFIYLAFFYLTAEMIRFVTPQLLSLLINFITNVTEPSWHGYLYAVGLFISCEMASILKNRYFFLAVNLSVKIRSALMSAVYRKALNLSGSARRETTIGQIVNMMAVDTVSVGDACWQLFNIIGAPIVILVALGFLWQKLGPSVLAGLAVLILLTPVNSYLANKTKECQLACIKLRDKRVKMVSEIIGGIKVLKLYAWEKSFANEVQDVRDEEMTVYRKIAFLQAFNVFIFHVSPFLVSLATFTTYLMVSENNVLTAELAFVSLSLFNIMKLPIVQMPSVISLMIQAYVALNRIKAFLDSGEIDQTAVCSDSSEEGKLVIRKGQFSWEGSDGLPTWTLRDIELNVTKGKLAAVVGTVGAGKSSLISALLGEITKESGTVVVNGSIAYVSQQAWLQNATIRDNITWGQVYDEKFYRKVIEACALLPDLEMLEGGDMTEVGEKGINLSGGQKQRISLARAVYRDADIILLDDPLSAVDAHVGRHIFDRVIGPEGLLKLKTRLLVTNAVTFIPKVDLVIVMKDGRIVEKGTYNELVAANGDFAQLIVQYITSSDNATDEDIQEICEQLEGVPKGEILRQISQISASGSHTPPVGRHLNKHDVRQKRYSETEEGLSDKWSWNGSLSKLHLNNGSLHTHLKQDLFRRTISNGTSGSIHTSGKGSRHLYESKTSLHSGNRSEKITEGTKEEQNNTIMLIDEEMQETGKVARYVYLTYCKAMGALFTILPVILLSLGQASVAGGNVWLSIWASTNESRSSDFDFNATMNATFPLDNGGGITRELFLAGYGLFGFAQAFFIFFGTLLVIFGSLRAANLLHRNLLDTIIRLPMSFFDTNPSGRIINRFSKEMNVLDINLPMSFRSFLSCFLQVVSTLVVIVGSTPVAAVVLIPIMIIYYALQVVYVSTSRQLKRIESVTKSPIYSHFSESIQGVSIIRAFHKQDEFTQESLRKIDRFLKAVNLNVSANRWVAVHLEMLGNLITFAAALLAVIGRETISPGIVGLSVTYALNITVVLNWLVRIGSDVEANIVSVERVNEYIQKDQEAAWEIADHKPSESWPENGTVSFNEYQTRYRPGLEPVLRGVTCSFKPAEKIGIVGRTGAGKSSLTLALFRLIESTSGSIVIDGVRIDKIGLHDLRSRLSIIPQDPVLFSGTLRLNLDPSGTRTDDEVWQSLELAHLKEYVKAQTLGLQHVVDEDGSNFSVGQRQLVCLARAVLRHSKILVLDEATAAIDLETDDLIQATIREQFANCTVLTIAHRLNTIMDYDRILVLDYGRIAEFDTPATLLADSSSIFHSMAKDAGLL